MFDLLKDFQNCTTESDAWLLFIEIAFIGMAIGVLTLLVFYTFSNKRDTYYHGQIDAIRGIIKWKLERNEDGEEIWVEIKDN